MTEKQLKKLEDTLVLSIRYARLKEEIGDTLSSVDAIRQETQIKTSALSRLFGTRNNEKVIADREKYVESVRKIILNTETEYPKNRYALYGTKKFDALLGKMSKARFGKMALFHIAARTATDNVCQYLNTEDFLVTLSQKLFGTPTFIADIKKQSNEVCSVILSGKKKIQALSQYSLDYSLILNALYLWQAKKTLPQADFYGYCAKTMKAINDVKKTVADEAFVKFHDQSENASKIRLLQSFDNYLIQNLKLIKE